MLDDPHSVYATLRADDPVHWSERLSAWVLTRHADCERVVQETNQFGSDFRAAGEQTPPELLSIQTVDPPDHTVHKAAILKALKGTDFRAWSAAIAGRAERLLAEVDPDLFDFVREFAEPVVAGSMSALFGVKLDEDPGAFRTAQRDLVLSMDAGLAPERLDAGIRARRYLSGLVDPAITSRETGTGLVSRIDFAAGEDLPYLVNSVRTILVAGHSSAGSMLVNAVHTLLSRGLLAGEPPVLDAISFNELVRFAGPVQAVSRAVLADTELGGVPVRRGDIAVAVLASANRDSAVFSSPDALMLDRAHNPHLGFGRGIHACLGTRLALMLWTAAAGVLTRDYRAEPAGDPVRRPSATVRSLDYLPVRLTPRRSAARRPPSLTSAGAPWSEHEHG